MAWTNSDGFNSPTVSHLQDRLPQDEFQKLWAERMAEAAQQDAEAKEDDHLEAAVDAYESFDKACLPGGLYHGLTPSQRLKIEADIYQSFGPRPELKTPAEIAAQQTAERQAQAEFLAIMHLTYRG